MRPGVVHHSLAKKRLAQRARLRTSVARSLAKKRLVRRARLDSGRCRVLPLRPGQARQGTSWKRPEPLLEKKWWPELPSWIALHAERGPRRKCWEGHHLHADMHDGRRYGCCQQCWWTPEAGTAILACRECRWSLCVECTGGDRLPLLRDDPLFRGPDEPCLLQPLRVDKASKEPRGGGGVAIVCPGGNYEFLCANEGLPVARWLADQGITAYVLRYRLLPKYSYPDALADLELAARLLRRCHRGPLLAVGFSAGGHLVASHAVAARSKGRRPVDAQVLVYPAIDGKDWVHPWKHGFWDWEPCVEKAEGMLEYQTALMGGRGFAAPPTFLVASTGDDVCPARSHGDVYAAALKRRRVPHEYVRGDLGGHGFGLEEEWTAPCAAWLNRRGFGTPSAV